MSKIRVNMVGESQKHGEEDFKRWRETGHHDHATEGKKRNLRCITNLKKYRSRHIRRTVNQKLKDSLYE